jgi:hypothetical protein
MISSTCFIRADCKGINEIRSGTSEMSGFTKLLLNLILPGITIFMKRRAKSKMICSYCGSNFLLPANTAETNSLLNSMEKIDSRLK